MSVGAGRPRGLLVALEGIDGSGKSSLARRLAALWRRRGWRVALAREPADPGLASAALRQARGDPWSAAMLFTLDRALSAERLSRALATHDAVVQDRSFYSTLAYQGVDLPPRARSRLASLQRRFAVLPDRVVWLELAPEAALARVAARGRTPAPTERLRVLARVDREYRRLARGARWDRFGADRPLDELVTAVDRALAPRIGRRLARR